MITFFWKTQHKLILQYVKVWLQFQWYVKIEQDLIQEHSPRIAQRNIKLPCDAAAFGPLRWFCQVWVPGADGTYAHELHLWSGSGDVMRNFWTRWNSPGSTFFQPSHLMFSTLLLFSTLPPCFFNPLVWQPFRLCSCIARPHLICFFYFLLLARSRIPERLGEGRFQGAPY